MTNNELLKSLLSSQSLLNRPYLIYRHNLLNHIGHISSREQGAYIQNTKNQEGKACYPLCYGPIQYIGLMPKENFSPHCLNSGLLFYLKFDFFKFFEKKKF